MRPALAIALGLAALATACGDPCGAPERCAYPTLLIFVYDEATNVALPQATITQNGQPLAGDRTPTFCLDGDCTHAVSPPAAGAVTISLPGYQDAVYDFVPAYGACGAPMRLVITVALRPTSDAMSSTIDGPVLRGSGCGR